MESLKKLCIPRTFELCNNQINRFGFQLSKPLQLETFDRLGTTTLEKINNLLDNLKDESSDNN